MTTIVATLDRMVSDSKITQESKNGDTYFEGPKLLRKSIGRDSVIIGTAGDSVLGDRFVGWYGTKKRKPSGFGKGADFEALVLEETGLYHFDEYLSRNKVSREWFSVGSGASAALGALYAGATPEQAIEIACKVDPHSGLPLQTLKLTTSTTSSIPSTVITPSTSMSKLVFEIEQSDSSGPKTRE